MRIHTCTHGVYPVLGPSAGQRLEVARVGGSKGEGELQEEVE